MKRTTANSDGFVRNVLTLVTGTTVAQAIPIALSPILTRMYGPEEFGVLAVFVAVTTVIGAVATFRYEMALMIAATEREAYNLGVLCITLTLAVSAVSAAIFVVWGDRISAMIGEPSVAHYLLLAPVSIFFIGLFNTLNYYNTRHRNYGQIARASASKSIVGVGTQLGLGIMTSSAGGLVAGQVISGAAANRRLYRAARRATEDHTVDRTMVLQLAKRYRQFPLLSTPAILANNLAVQMSNVLISTMFSISTLGLYSMVQRVLGLPTALVGQSVSQVFFQQATEERRVTGRARGTLVSTTRRLLVVGLPAFVAAYLLAPVMFGWVFGPDWRIAGEYAQILVPMFFLRFVAASVSTTTSVFERQGVALLWQLGLLALSVGAVVAGGLMGWSFRETLEVYTLVVSIHYIVLWLIMYRISGGARADA